MDVHTAGDIVQVPQLQRWHGVYYQRSRLLRIRRPQGMGGSLLHGRVVSVARSGCGTGTDMVACWTDSSHLFAVPGRGGARVCERVVADRYLHTLSAQRLMLLC